jgi:hypothetical protein
VYGVCLFTRGVEGGDKAFMVLEPRVCLVSKKVIKYGELELCGVALDVGGRLEGA